MGNYVVVDMRTDRPNVINEVSAEAPKHVHIEQMNDALYHMEIGDRHFEMAINDGLLEMTLFEDVEEGEDGGRGQA